MSKVRILSPRPEINKKVAFDATFFIYFCGTWIQTTKFFCHVRTFPSLDTMCRLWGIRDDFAACTCKIYSLSPRPRNSKPPLRAVFYLKPNIYTSSRIQFFEIAVFCCGSNFFVFNIHELNLFHI